MELKAKFTWTFKIKPRCAQKLLKAVNPVNTLYKFALFELLFSNKHVYKYLGEKYSFKSIKHRVFKKSLTGRIQAVSPDIADSLMFLRHRGLSMDKPETQREAKIPGLNLKLGTPAFKAELHHHTMRYWAYYFCWLLIHPINIYWALGMC